MRLRSVERAQVALEFMIIYSSVLIIFALLFALIANQRAASLNQQEYSLLQLQAQNIAGYINQALIAGNGYSAVILALGNIGSTTYSLNISTAGVILTQLKIGTQQITAYAFSNGRNLVINGTKTAGSNGIGIYSIPLLSGAVSISNSKGVIYVDEPAVSVTGLPTNLRFAQNQGARVGVFNGQTSVSKVSNFPAENTITLSAWIYPLTYGSTLGGSDIMSAQCSDNGYFLELQGSSSDALAFGIQCLSGGVDITSLKPNLDTWTMVTVTYNVVSNSGEMYINGVPSAAITLGATATIVNQEMDIGDGSDGFFTGDMANVQAYNGVLSAGQVASLYAEGIGGAPVAPGIVVGWWPLGGNANDYGGSGLNGVPTSISNATVAQLTAHATGGSGGVVASAPIGFTASNGILGPNGRSYVGYTDGSGNVSAYLTSNGAAGISNTSVNLFNSNLTTAGDLIGWWPLNEGGGNVVYDLSDNFDNGAFTSPQWNGISNSTNIAVAEFGGAGSEVLTSYASPIESGAFSVDLWVSFTSVPSGTETLVAKENGNGNDGWGLVYVAGSSSLDLYKNGVIDQYFTWTPSPDTWYNIVAAETGSSATVYVDGAPLGTVSNSQAFKSSSGIDMSIGGDTAGDYLTGKMAGIELYSTALSSQQAGLLYSEGISGTPLSNSGLAGWWPLNDNAKDESSGGSNGLANSITYSNLQFSPVTISSTLNVANFNGADSNVLIVPTTNLDGYNAMSFSMWVNPSACPTNSAHLCIITSKAGSPPNDAYWLGVGNDGDFHYSITQGWVDYNSMVSVPYGSWTYLTLVVGNGKALTYKNGVLSDTQLVASGAFNHVPANVMIGEMSPQNGGGSYFRGQIADLQMYNSVLTSTQVLQLFEQGLPPYQRFNLTMG